jgi:hypothetical protein
MSKRQATIEPSAEVAEILGKEVDTSIMAPVDYGDPNFDFLKNLEAIGDPIEQETPGEPVKAPTKPVEPLEDPAPDKAKETPAEPEKGAPDAEEYLIEEKFFGDEPDNPEPEVKTDADFDKETEDMTKGMSVDAGKRFKELRAELKETKKKVSELVAPNEVAAKDAALKEKEAEIESLRKTVDELSSVSPRLRMEASEAYKTAVLAPVVKIFEQVDEMAASYEIEPENLKNILKAPDRKSQNELIAEHLRHFSELDRQDFYGMIREFNGLRDKRAEMLSKAGEEVEKLDAARQKEQEQAIEEHKKVVQELQSGLWSKYKDKIPGLLDDKGDETEDFKKLYAEAKRIDFSKARGKDQAFAAFAGTLFPFVAKQLVAANRKIAELEGGLKKSVNGKPAASQSVTSDSSSTPSANSFMDGLMIL